MSKRFDIEKFQKSNIFYVFILIKTEYNLRIITNKNISCVLSHKIWHDCNKIYWTVKRLIQ